MASQNGIPTTMEDGVKELITEETAVNKELSDVLAKIKTLREARDKVLNDPKSQHNKTLDAAEQKIVAALEKKSQLYDDMNALRHSGKRGNIGDEQASIAENLSIWKLKRAPLRDAKDSLTDAIRKATKTVNEDTMRADKIRMKLPAVDGAQGEVVTIVEMDKIYKKLEQKLAKADKNPSQITLADHLRGEKKQYDKHRPNLEEYWRLVESIFDVKTKLAGYQKELETVTAELKAIEDKMTELSGQQRPRGETEGEKEEKEERKKESDKIWAEIQLVTKEIDVLRKEKQKTRDSIKTGENGQSSDELKELTTQRDAYFDKLKEIRAKIPTKTVSYNKAFHSDLIGSKGATIQGLQEEFGVVLNVNYDKGEIQIKGSEDDIGVCEEAVATLLKNVEDSKCSLEIPFDTAVSRELIGPGGSQITKMQEASGAKINVDSKTSTITITGMQAAVDLGKQIVEEFLSSTTRATIKFKPDLGDVVVGRGGKTVKRVQEESGAKNINIKKDSGTIEIMGSKDAVETAKQMYEELIQSFSSGGLELKVPGEMIGLVVGKGGATIMKLQDDTGCVVLVNRPEGKGYGKGGKGGMASVNIKGSAKGVAAARAMIEELMASNAKDTEKIPYDPNLRLFLIRPPKDDPSGICPLEKIKRESGCFRVEAVRGENYVSVTGKKEAVEKGVQMLKEMLDMNARDVVKIPFPAVLFGAIGVREEGSDSVMDGIRKEFGCEAASADKNSSTITIVAEAEAAASAAAKVKEMIASMEANIETITVPNERVIPIIIGSGGQNINRLRRETGVEINLDRDSMTAVLYGPAEGRAQALVALNKIFDEQKDRDGDA